MQFITPKRIKILSSLLLAFVGALVLNNSVFIANSPNINPVFIANIQSLPGKMAAFPDRMIAMFANMSKPSNYGAVATNVPSESGQTNNLSQVQNTNQGSNPAQEKTVQFTQPNQPTLPVVQPTAPQNLQYQPVANGVYAATDPLTNIRYINVKEGTQMEVREYTITLADGTQKNYKVMIPVGE